MRQALAVIVQVMPVKKPELHPTWVMKPMELIVLPSSNEDSGATIPAETVLDSTMADDWKVTHTGSAQQLEDWFDKEVHIPTK